MSSLINRNPNLIFPPLLKLALEGIAKANAAGISIGIFEGYRSIARQNEIYEQGRTKPGNIVTKAKGGESWHNYGLAFDIAGLKNGKWHWQFDPKVLPNFFATSIRWGGDFGDPPHYEWRNLPKIKDVQNKHIFEIWDSIVI